MDKRGLAIRLDRLDMRALQELHSRNTKVVAESETQDTQVESNELVANRWLYDWHNSMSCIWALCKSTKENDDKRSNNGPRSKWTR